MLLACDGENSNYDDEDEGPEETWNGVEVVAQKLHGQTGGVVNGDVVTKHGERKDDKAEFGPASGMIDRVDEATETVICVRIGVWLVSRCDGGVAETGPDDDGEGSRDHYAPECEGEDLPKWCCCWEMAIVV